MKIFLTECTHPITKETYAGFNIQANNFEEAEQLTMAVEDWLEVIGLPRTGLKVIGEFKEIVKIQD